MNEISKSVFDRYIGIDYSGAETLISSLKVLRVGSAIQKCLNLIRRQRNMTVTTGELRQADSSRRNAEKRGIPRRRRREGVTDSGIGFRTGTRTIIFEGKTNAQVFVYCTGRELNKLSRGVFYAHVRR